MPLPGSGPPRRHGPRLLAIHEKQTSSGSPSAAIHTVMSKMHIWLLLSSLLWMAVWTPPAFTLPQSSIIDAPGHPLQKRASPIHCFVQPLPPSGPLPPIKRGDCRHALNLFLQGDKILAPILFGRHGPYKVPHYISFNTCILGFDIFKSSDTALVSINYIGQGLSILIAACIEDGPGNGGMVNIGDRGQLTVMAKGRTPARGPERFQSQGGMLVFEDGTEVHRLWPGTWEPTEGREPSITDWMGPPGPTVSPLREKQIPYAWGGPKPPILPILGSSPPLEGSSSSGLSSSSSEEDTSQSKESPDPVKEQGSLSPGASGSQS